jgi:hypothetical protein
MIFSTQSSIQYLHLVPPVMTIRTIATIVLLLGFAIPSHAQTLANASSSHSRTQPQEVPVEPTSQELTRLERRLAVAACRALRSGVLADALVARVERSLINRGMQEDVLALTTGFMGEALDIGTEELCAVR